MTTRRNFIRMAATIGLVSPFILQSQQAMAATYQAYTYLNVAEKPGVVGLQSIADAISAATDGNITFQVNLAGSLSIKPSDMTQALGDGVIQLADNQSYLGVVPIAGILRLPGLIDNVEEYEKAFAIMKPVLEKEFARQGVKVLGGYVYPPQVIFSTSRIDSLDALKGKKIRVSSTEQGKMMELLGAFPVTLPTSELPTALQRNLVDGALTASAGGARTLGELLKSSYRLNISTIDGFYMMNSDFYESLPDDVRATVDKAGADAGIKATKMLAEQEPEWTEKLSGQGVEIIQPAAGDAAFIREAVSGYWDEWAANAGGEAPALLAQIREALGR